MTKIRAAFADADIPSKLQLHTRKHHNAYNGARSLPILTWVRPLSTGTISILLSTETSPPTNSEDVPTSQEEEPSRPQDEEELIEIQIDDQDSSASSSGLETPPTPTTTESESTETETETEILYEVKLYYPQNRACTIYRSWDDFVLLRRGLDSTRYKSLPNLDDQDVATGDGAGICAEKHIHDSACLHGFLKYVMERCSTSTCTSQAEPAVEYFLRRRMDDCDGGGGGSDFMDIW